jgi:hypothetical protein
MSTSVTSGESLRLLHTFRLREHPYFLHLLDVQRNSSELLLSAM